MSNRPRGFTRYSKEKYLLSFMLGFGVFLICALPLMISNGGYYVYSGDYNAQQIAFYNMANDAVRDGQFGWNWYTDLGTDFMTSYAFYLFGSPFFWMSVALPRGLVTLAMPFLLAMKHGFASLTAYAYIRRFVRDKSSALIGGLLYAFSGFQAYNVFFNHFHDVTAFFPLMLIAMEENINGGKKGLFAVIVAFMAINNFYFFVGQTVFLVLYYLFRLPAPDFHTSWKKFFLLCFEAVIGTMIAAFILLPTALDIITNPRVKDIYYGTEMLLYPDDTVIPRIIQTFFMTPDTPGAPNLFASDYEKWASIGGYLPLFSMAGVIAFMRGKKKHWATRLSIACIVFAFVPVLNALFQAYNFYYYARWFYMPILIFAMMTAVSIDDESSDLHFGWKFCLGAVVTFAVIACLPMKRHGGDAFFFIFPEDVAYFWVTIGVAAVFLVISKILFDRRKKGLSFRKPAVVATLFACVGCYFTVMLYTANTISGARLYADALLRTDSCVERSSKDNFFRMDASEGDDNINMFWEGSSMRCFHSVVNTSIMDFYEGVGLDRSVASRADISHYTLRGLFSVKYFYRDLDDVQTYSEFLENPDPQTEKARSLGIYADYSNFPIPEEMPGFEYRSANDYYEYYENELFIPMGIAFDSYITESEAKTLPNKNRERSLIKALILTDEQAEKYGDIMTEYRGRTNLDKDDYVRACKEKQAKASSSFSCDSHGFKSEITLDKPALVFYSVPYSKGWTAEVNGEKVDVEKVDYGLMAVKADAGDNKIVFKYRTPGLTEGLYISLAGVLLLAAYLLVCRFVCKKNGEKRFSHYYDYPSRHKVSASQEYIRGVADMKGEE